MRASALRLIRYGAVQVQSECHWALGGRGWTERSEAKPRGFELTLSNTGHPQIEDFPEPSKVVAGNVCSWYFATRRPTTFYSLSGSVVWIVPLHLRPKLKRAIVFAGDPADGCDGW